MRVQFQTGGIFWILSLFKTDFQGSASDEDEEGAASGEEEKDPTTRDIVIAIMNMNAELKQARMDRQAEKWTPR